MSRLRSLRLRLAIVYAAVAALVLVVAYSAAGAALEAGLISSAAERLEIEAGLVVADASGKRGPTATDLAAGDLAEVLGGHGTAVVILDESGNVVAAEQNGAASAVAEARLSMAAYADVIAGGKTVHEVHVASSGRVLMVAVPVALRTTGGPGNPGNGRGNGKGLGNGGNAGNPAGGPPAVAAQPNAVAQLAISLASVDATLAATQAKLQLVGIGLLVGVAFLVWIITRAGLRPLERVAGAADRIAAGDLSARAALQPGDDEISRLGRAFDSMAERVDATARAQAAFAADASHELRSPLTVLGGYVDVLRRGGMDEATRTRTLDAMRRELDRLSRLSSDLLLLNRLQAGEAPAASGPVDLGGIVQDIGEAARMMGPDRRVEVASHRPLVVIADADRMTQAVMNLVDNAVRHTPPGDAIRITAGPEGSEAVVAVANGGSPIAAADLGRIFDRFFRAGVPVDGGTHAGLGLAIVKAIAEGAGGAVTASSDDRETRFEIRLPLASASSA